MKGEKMKRIYIISGSKGGVGKSFVSFALLDYLTQKNGDEVCLVETETDNADVAKAYLQDERVKVETLRLDDADGWIQLVNMCGEIDKDVVVNTAARSIEAVMSYAETLTGSLEELERESVSFWVVNRQRDSVELLRKYAQHMTGPLHVVRNNHYGDGEKFELFNNSETAKKLSERGKTLDFPDLADRVADDLYIKRLSIIGALSALPIGNKAELRRWRKLAWEMFDSVIDTEEVAGDE